MRRKRFTPERIIHKLRQAEVAVPRELFAHILDRVNRLRPVPV